MRPFVRDIELHGHHSECLARFNALDPDAPVACICQELDEDDWQAYLDVWQDDRKERDR